MEMRKALNERSVKLDSFEYVLSWILALRGSDGLTMISALKLLFFVVGASCGYEDRGLTAVFNRFVAMPYGPVEMDVYIAMQQKKLPRYLVTAESVRLERGLPYGDGVDRASTDESLEYLLRESPDILRYAPFDLVNLSHRLSCWRDSYSKALNEGHRREEMPSEGIQYSTKYYRM